MPQFVYEAQDAAGQLVTGVLQSQSQREAIGRLNELKLLPLGMTEQSAATSRIRLSRRQLVKLYQMLSDLLESGMPLLRSLELLASQTTQPAMKSMLADIAVRVADGMPLARAMSQHPDAFDDLTCNMVRAGEEGGFLEQSLTRVAMLHERRAALVSSLTGALAYPAFLLLVGLCVVTGMIIFFVPKFEPLFHRLRESGELPWATESLLATSSLLRHYGWIVILLFALLVTAIVGQLRSPAGRLNLDRWLLKAKGIGPIITGAVLAIYCRVLGTLLTNGVPVLDAMRVAQGTAANRALKSLLARAAERVASGGAFADQLSQDALVPQEIIEVIRVGERSNRMDVVLIKIADQLDARNANQLALIAKLIEPALMVVMAILIGFLMVALLMPVFLSSGRFN